MPHWKWKVTTLNYTNCILKCVVSRITKILIALVIAPGVTAFKSKIQQCRLKIVAPDFTMSLAEISCSLFRNIDPQGKIRWQALDTRSARFASTRVQCYTRFTQSCSLLFSPLAKHTTKHSCTSANANYRSTFVRSLFGHAFLRLVPEKALSAHAHEWRGKWWLHCLHTRVRVSPCYSSRHSHECENTALDARQHIIT